MANQRSGFTLAPIQVLFEAGSAVGRADADLLDQFTTGAAEQAEAAFAAIVERHGPLVLRVARRILRDSHAADDTFQATFVILARRAGSIRRRGSLAAWLHGVAAHVAMAARVAEHRRQHHEAHAGAIRPGVSPDFAPADDLGAIVHEELGRLPERYRTAIVLCCLQGLTQQEAAAQAGWPLGTLQSRLARGRNRLRVGLTRRGLAPAVALAAATFGTESALAAVPARLALATVPLALTGGIVPPAVQFLVTRGVRAMVLTQWKTATLLMSLTVGLIATGAGAWALGHAPPAPVPAPVAVIPPDDGLLTVTGMVILPDGSPAPGATVTSFGGQNDSSSVQTDLAGRFTLRGTFDNSGRLHSQFQDGKLQAVRTVAEGDVRTAFARPIELRLAAAVPHLVLVRANGQPVAGAVVVGEGTDCVVQARTGPDGGAVLYWLPSARPDSLVAWHPDGGIAELDLKHLQVELMPTTVIALDLLPRHPQTIRAVDSAGRGVAGLELAIAFLPQSAAQTRAWIMTSEIPAAHVQTDATGAAVIPWAPRGPLQSIEVDLVGTDWKIDTTDQDRLADGLTTVHVRREHAVQGRLVMPNGVSAEGIGITGFGFGPQSQGDIPFARARKDGTFTIRVPADHGYSLGVLDSEWASDPWTGQILATDDAEPAKITIPVYPSTPLTVRVTRGPDHEPVVDAFVHLGTKTDFSWTDATGQRRSGTGGPEFWTRTDTQGLVCAGVGRGDQHIRLETPTWNEERTVKITANPPATVEFYRPWIGQRRIAGRLTSGTQPYLLSPDLKLAAWVTERNNLPERIDIPIRPDGTFGIFRDAATIEILAHDPKQHLAASKSILPDATTVDLVMQPTATYGGTLVDENDQPMADQAVQIQIKSVRSEPVATTRTDDKGGFHFASVPAATPLEVFLKHDRQADWSQFIFDNGLLFQPSEARLDQKVHAQWAYGGGESIPPPRPVARKLPALAASVATTVANARVAGMVALAVIRGDDSGSVGKVADALVDYDRTSTILSYLPIQLMPDRARSEAATLAQLGWPAAGSGEVVLAVLDAAGKPTATQILTTADPASAIGRGDAFLGDHRPPTRDALIRLTRARQQAEQTQRRVLVIVAGPRCGPCFRFAHWLDAHHAVLERDYVLAEVMEGVDDHAAEAMAHLPIQPGEGVPWFAITEPDGKILATSVGPLGNVGFPTGLESARHFRTMLDATRRQLTPAEVDGLVQSLTAEH